MNWWAAQLWEKDHTLFVSWVFWIIFSVVMHELSHGWAALRAGDDTPRATGHMTWNPLVHMGGFSLIMFAVVGICWGAMPINPNRFRKRHDDALVAAAGPAMNLGLGLASCLLSAAWILFGAPRVSGDLAGNIYTFLWVGASVNLALLFFNLIPVPPLDGSKILASFVRPYRDLLNSERGPMIAMTGLIILFYLLNGKTFIWSMHAVNYITRSLLSLGHGSAP